VNSLDLEFIARWKEQTWNECTEADVREELVTPLLWHLGYAKNTVNDILREKSLALPPLFLQIASAHRIKIDYLNKVMLQNFWVLETKRPDDDLSTADLNQAFSYALHPSVRALYVVLTNGRIVRIYEVSGDRYDEPIVECTQANPEITFERLRQTLGVRNIGATLRTRTLETVGRALAVEIDESVIDDYRTRFLGMLDGARATIRDNRNRLTQKAWKKAFEASDVATELAPWEKLIIGADLVISLQHKWGNEIGQRLLAAPESERPGMLDQLAMQWRGRPHAIFRVHALTALMTVYQAGIEIEGGYVPSVRHGIEELVRAARTYYAFSPLSNALCRLDNSCIRTAYKIVRTASTEDIMGMLSAERERYAPMDVLSSTEGVASRVIALTGLVAEYVFWRQYAYGDLALAEAGIEQLGLLEESLRDRPMPPYPPGDGDLTAFLVYGAGHDMLFMGTWDVMHMREDFVATSTLPDDIKEFASMTHDQGHVEMKVAYSPIVGSVEG
jgi:hypothetical protein